MRIFAAILLLATATCHAADTSSLTTKIHESDTDKDGQLDIRTEMIYRGEARVMMTMSRRNPKGQMQVTSRIFMTDGQIRMGESDEDGDGFLELLCIYATGTGGLELFTRKPDGSVAPVPPEVLAIHKKFHAMQDDVGQVMRNVIEGKTTAEEAAAEVLKVREKGEALKQELQKAKETPKR
jgi:hypothetical protein